MQGSLRLHSILRPDSDKNQPLLTIQWVPVYRNILGKELADGAVKQAALLPGSNRTVTNGSVCAQVRACTSDPLYYARTHERGVWSTLEGARITDPDP